MANRLAQQSSPYLQQHKDNPVDWYPWGEEAFAAAKQRGVPILVSIGYSTCHWCHVMAHESFEDPVLGQLMNENFVNIKVDREERPDVDALYMQAVQLLGYNTGWPLNVFLTPDGLPFFGGTYWPRQARDGMPSFTNVLINLSELWQRDRSKVVRGGQEVAKHLISSSDLVGSPTQVTAQILQRVMRALYEKFDKKLGGFGPAPKFPQAPTLEFLLRHYSRTQDVAALSMVEITIGAMAEGGIHDQIGGGFSRYSVDGEWHVPHFEKMLYDNALLLPIYADTYVHTQEPLFKHTAEGIVQWLEREMRLPHGGYAAALDADSEGVEGKFYIWTAAEIDKAFDADDADLLKLHFGIADPGTFEGATVLRVVKSDEDLADELSQPLDDVQRRLDNLKAKMLKIRQKRVRPHRDDKAIASWNGMAINGLASSGLALQKPEWIEIASRVARFVVDKMLSEDGSLARSYTNGASSSAAVLDDYAQVIRGLLTLYNASGNDAWLEPAWTMTEYVRAHFPHESGIGFYDTPDTSKDLFTRPRDLTDTATPAGNAAMAEVLQIIGVMRRDDSLIDEGRRIIESMVEVLPRYPKHTGTLSTAAERMVVPPRELIFAGRDVDALRNASAFRIDPLIIRGYVSSQKLSSGEWVFLNDKPAGDTATAYYCRDYACKAPVSDPDALVEAMRS